MRGPIVIKLEMEALRHEVALCLSSQALGIDQQIEAAILEFCKPEYLASMVREQVKLATKQAIESTVDSFFLYGAGRKAVNAAVNDHLEAELAAAMKIIRKEDE